ncbi:uncharacterized protein UHOD_12238 [Ustilago sp. UG-2017b]|nr:uncharacterized protein UHOD_12238 [Ustilago sp. UG-2017b]
MDSAASSSSGSHGPAFNADPTVPRDDSGIKDLDYYYSSFVTNPELPTLTNDKLEKHLNTLIHYKGTPVLFTDADDETKVQHTLKRYPKVWLVAPPTPEQPRKVRHLYLEKGMDSGIDTLNRGTSGWIEVRNYVEAARKFKSEHGDNALYLRYGRPFAERKVSKFFGYNVPQWNALKRSSTPAYDLEKARFPHLRNTLDQYNYLKGYDSKNRLLGFKLDKNGNVLLEYLGQYHPRV